MAQGDLTKLEGRLHTAVTSARRRSRPARYGRTEWPCPFGTIMRRAPVSVSNRLKPYHENVDSEPAYSKIAINIQIKNKRSGNLWVFRRGPRIYDELSLQRSAFISKETIYD